MYLKDNINKLVKNDSVVSEKNMFSENPLFSLFPIEKPKFPNLTLP